jgi:hypothetical protein
MLRTYEQHGIALYRLVDHYWLVAHLLATTEETGELNMAEVKGELEQLSARVKMAPSPRDSVMTHLAWLYKTDDTGRGLATFIFEVYDELSNVYGRDRPDRMVWAIRSFSPGYW